MTPVVNVSEEEEEMGWTVMPEHVQLLEQRVAQMEGAINSIVHHLEALNPNATNTPNEKAL